MTNIIPGMTINTDINASIFISEIGYYISFVIKIYYNLNDTIGLNVFNINLIYLLLA